MIKMYEEFINKNLYNGSGSIFEYEELLDSFLDDIKDISINGYEKKILFSNIIYCFLIKNYENKKKEIDIFLQEIESACKSININFKYYFNICDTTDIIYSSVKIDYVFLEFCLDTKPFLKRHYFIFEDLLERFASRLGITINYKKK